MFLLMLLFSPLVSITMETAQVPKGHLESLGNHRPSDGHIEILHTMPHPVEFWEKYVSNGEPVLFRGAANHSPGVKLWTDEYLLEHYQQFKVKIESKWEKYDSPVGKFGIGQESVGNFIRRYEDDNVYIVSQLPDPMAKEVSVPSCLLCGTFQDHITEANLWFSSGGTKSLLHRDADDAINCLYNGTKDWILIHPRDEDKIPIAREAFDAYGGFSVLDPAKVDLLKHPQFVNVPWKYVHVKSGDCLFLPKGYWHRVTSAGAKNLAVSLLFGRIHTFNPVGCEEGKPDSKLLSEVGTVWGYDGIGIQSMGNQNPFELNDTLQEFCQQNLQHRISVEDIYDYLLQDLESEEVRNVLFEDGDDSYIEHVKNMAVEYIRILGDVESRGYVTCNQVNVVSMQQLKDISSLVSMDPGNTEEMEFYKFTVNNIESFLMNVCGQKDNSLDIDIEQFKDSYLEIGGTSMVASKIFHILDENMDGLLTVEEITLNLEHVLALYDRISIFASGAVMDNEFDFTMDNSIQQDFQKDEKDYNRVEL